MSSSKSIVTSTFIVTAVTFAIKFLGLVKQSVLASYCGATDETDAFFIASGVIVSLATIFFSAISVSLLTIHTKKLVDDGREMANELINVTLKVFLPISILVSVLFVVGAKYVAKFLAPTYDPEQISLLAHYIKILSIVFVLWCYYLTINVVLETDKEFVPGRMQGFFQNVFLIIAAIFLFGKWGIESLIWSFILSGIAECLLVTWCARKRFKIVFKSTSVLEKDVLNLISLSVPLLIGNALYEINDIVDKQVSSGLGTGNVSYLTYGSTINEIVTGVVVASVSIVVFSHFATWAAEGDKHKIGNALNKCIESLTIIIFPIMSMCLFAGDDILKIFYGRGSFGSTEIQMTQTVVIGYSVGFIFSAIRAIIVKVFYAFQDTKRPLYNGIISIAFNILLSITLSKFIGVAGVALATSLAMFLSAFLLISQIKHHMPEYNSKSFISECLKGLGSFLVTSLLVFLIHSILNMNVFVKIVIEGSACLLSYIVVLYILKSSTIKNLFLAKATE